MILYRRKILIHLLKALGGDAPAVDFQKFLFLLAQMQDAPTFDFVPHKFGCFSFQSYADRRWLTANGFLADDSNWRLNPSALKTEDITIRNSDALAIEDVIQKFGKLCGDELVHEVYVHYPFFATRSEIADRILNDQELRAIEKARPMAAKKGIFSIGYEGRSIDAYICELVRNNIHLLCDVRRNPLSRKYGFSKNELKRLLELVGIGYMHIPELGIDSSERQELKTFEDYQRLFGRYEKKTLSKSRKHLERILDVMESQKRVALTCFEADVKCCHRSRVSDALEKLTGNSVTVEHL